MSFDWRYYEDLWGTVHRHDYCANLADRLIGKYGRSRILDIGTGCGFLVKALRERDCDAWGVDISEYAVAHSCSPFVIQADMRFLPWPDHYFNVIHSQGVWEYLREDEIAGALREALRVGDQQCHTIDPSGSVIGEEGFVTSKSLEWWADRLQCQSVS